MLPAGKDAAPEPRRSRSSGSGQLKPERRARCRHSTAAVAPIPSLRQAGPGQPLRLETQNLSDLPHGQSLLRHPSLPPVQKGRGHMQLGSPNGASHALPRHPQPLLRESLGTGARDQSEQPLGINRNRCSGSLGAPRGDVPGLQTPQGGKIVSRAEQEIYGVWSRSRCSPPPAGHTCHESRATAGGIAVDPVCQALQEFPEMEVSSRSPSSSRHRCASPRPDARQDRLCRRS